MLNKLFIVNFLMFFSINPLFCFINVEKQNEVLKFIEIDNILNQENNDVIIEQQRKESYIIENFNVVLQDPELPTGCEITALTQTLNFYGFDVTKTYLCDNYLPYGWVNTSLNESFIGDPYTKSGYGCNAPVIERAAQNYFDDNGIMAKAKNITGATPEELYEYVSKETPVIVWATMSMVSPTLKYLWKSESGEEIYFNENEHCMTLIGYDNETVTVADPRKGIIQYDRKLFEERYTQLGNQAIVITDILS